MPQVSVSQGQPPPPSPPPAAPMIAQQWMPPLWWPPVYPGPLPVAGGTFPAKLPLLNAGLPEHAIQGLWNHYEIQQMALPLLWEEKGT